MARRALLIGVSEYGEGFEPLPGSLLDVRAMAAVLADPERGAYGELTPLENPGRDEMAQAIERFFQGKTKDDSLLLYFSGHGDLGPGFRQKLHFCARGTFKSNGQLMKSSALSVDFLKEQLDDCKAGQLVVILDCCHSGAIADVLRKGEGESAFAALKAEGRVILASSSASQSSYQARDGLSLYTHYLLEGMDGAARDQPVLGEWILARELHDHAKRRLAVEKGGGLAPEIFVEKRGYDVGVVRAPRLDPVLEYRQAVDALFQRLDRQEGLRFDGEIQNPLARMSLETLQRRLEPDGLTGEQARQIEAEVQEPYRRRAEQRFGYFRAFEVAVQDGFLPKDGDRVYLEQIRQNLGLGQADAEQIEQLIGQERQLKPRPVAVQEAAPPRVQPQPRQAEPVKRQARPEQSEGGLAWRSLEFEAVMLKVTTESTGFLGLGSRVNLAQQRQPGKAEYFVEDLGNGVALEMVRIPAGKFVMGSPASEEGRSDDEGPQREVRVPEFALGRFAVTQAQYEAVMGNNPSRFQGSQRPVEQVSWNDAQAFCQKLSERTGRQYRLPSEAEWEYACRAGTTTPFHFGETISTDVANYDGNYTYGKGPKGQYREQTMEVGSFPPNGFGLCDMHGNVWEWCEDRCHSNYEGAPTDGPAWIDGDTTKEARRVLRGGSWFFYPRLCRSACRFNASPGVRDPYYGFRVVCVSARAV